MTQSTYRGNETKCSGKMCYSEASGTLKRPKNRKKMDKPPFVRLLDCNKNVRHTGKLKNKVIYLPQHILNKHKQMGGICKEYTSENVVHGCCAAKTRMRMRRSTPTCCCAGLYCMHGANEAQVCFTPLIKLLIGLQPFRQKAHQQQRGCHT